MIIEKKVPFENIDTKNKCKIQATKKFYQMKHKVVHSFRITIDNMQSSDN